MLKAVIRVSGSSSPLASKNCPFVPDPIGNRQSIKTSGIRMSSPRVKRVKPPVE